MLIELLLLFPLFLHTCGANISSPHFFWHIAEPAPSLSLSPSLSPSLLKLQQWNMEHNANQPLQHPPHSHLLTQTEKKTPSNETLRSPKRKECLSFLLFYVSVFAKLSLSYHVIFPQVLFRELLCHLSCKPGSSLD